jgi:hypothetical protein
MVLMSVRCPHCHSDQVIQGGMLNLSYFVAREIWRSRSVLPLPGRPHRLQRRQSLRCLPGLMDTTFDLLHTARN